MEHSAHLVDVLNKNGAVVGQKRRSDIDKTKGTYHTVFVLLVTPGRELVLGEIPKRRDLPNLYAHKLSTTTATIRRHNETALQAATRSLKRELNMDDADLTLLGESLLPTPGGLPNLATAFYCHSEPPKNFSALDIDRLVVVTPQLLRRLISTQPERLAPSLLALWERYEKKLPI